MSVDIEAILARANAATKGEWICHLGQPDDMPANTCRCRSLLTFGDCYFGGIGEVYVDNGKRVADGGNDCPPEAEARANARFITAARTDVPAMANEILALRAAITQALALIENDAPDMAVETLRAALGIEEGP